MLAKEHSLIGANWREKRNITGTQNDHAADQPRDCEKMFQGDGKDEVDLEHPGDLW